MNTFAMVDPSHRSRSLFRKWGKISHGQTQFTIANQRCFDKRRDGIAEESTRVHACQPRRRFRFRRRCLIERTYDSRANRRDCFANCHLRDAGVESGNAHRPHTRNSTASGFHWLGADGRRHPAPRVSPLLGARRPPRRRFRRLADCRTGTQTEGLKFGNWVIG